MSQLPDLVYTRMSQFFFHILAALFGTKGGNEWVKEMAGKNILVEFEIIDLLLSLGFCGLQVVDPIFH